MTGILKRSKGRGPMLDRNLSLPTDPMSLIRSWLDGLEPCPKNDYLKKVIFEKFVDANTDPADVRERRAIEKWLTIEGVNAETNLRLATTDPTAVLLPGVRFGEFVDKCRDIISSIIGDTVPETTLGSFSGGASTSRSKRTSNPALKYVGKAHITRACQDVFDIHDFPLWNSLSPPEMEVVRGAKMFTVPKNAVIDRVACKEPDINMYLQKGIGSQIRRMLRKRGVNLQDQSVNRRYAQLGSATGALATLDLSSASDSVSYELVFQLMPICWFSYLNSIRSSVVEIDGHYHETEMFSSMGNGFTFELESLLFYALARTTAYFTRTKGVISVYGDDLIVPSSLDHAFRHVLFYFGFSPNVLKSFSEGPFRESCGGHYHNGNDITPFFIRRPIVKLTDLILFLNNLRIWAGREQTLFLDPEAYPLWDLLKDLVPAKFRGGDATSAGTTQLISPGIPHKRLREVTAGRSLPEVGKYLQWLNNNESREDVPFLEDQTDSVVIHTCREVRANHWTWHNCGLLWLEESDCGTRSTPVGAIPQ